LLASSEASSFHSESVIISTSSSPNPAQSGRPLPIASDRIRARIEELQNAVTATGNTLLNAENAHRAALRRAVESGDYTPTQHRQAERDDALSMNARTRDALDAAREMLADALRNEAAEARARAVEALKPLYDTHASSAARCDAVFAELFVALRETLTAGCAVTQHIRTHSLVPLSQPIGQDNRGVPRVYARVLEALAVELGGGALTPTQLPDTPATKDAEAAIGHAQREVARGLS
jgi:hypothetical protein